MTDKLATPITTGLLGELVAGLAAEDRPVCLSYIAHTAALPPMDGCACECTISMDDGDHDGQGEAWIRVAGIAPANTGAAPSRSGSGFTATRDCTHRRWQLTLGLGVYRCVAAVPDADGQVDPVSKTADALLALADAATVRRVVAGSPLLNVADKRTRWELGAWQPIGPIGGCYGSVTTVTIELPECRTS